MARKRQGMPKNTYLVKGKIRRGVSRERARTAEGHVARAAEFNPLGRALSERKKKEIDVQSDRRERERNSGRRPPSKVP